jgi:hypothetical protein
MKFMRIKSRKTIGQMMIWSCVGMAYFNFFSSLNVSPGLQFGLSGVLPMTALIGYLLLRSWPSLTMPSPTKRESP